MATTTKTQYKRNKKGEFSKTTKEYTHLTRNPEVKHWIRIFKKPTAHQYLHHLNRFLKEMELKVKDLIETDEKDLKDVIIDYALKKRDDKRAGDLAVFLYMIKSFLKKTGKKLEFDKSERVLFKPTNKVRKTQHFLSTEEVYKLSEATKSIRDKAIIIVLAQSGIRVNALTRLTIGMVKDNLDPQIKVPVPLKITDEIDTKISSYDIGLYYTFLHHESAEALKDYLEQRERKGEDLNNDSPLFLSKRGTGIKIRQIQRVMKEACERLGLKGVSAHSLRKYFSNIVKNATIDEDTKEFLMGHKLPNSRGNYFDYKGVKEIGGKYMKGDWSRESKGKMNKIERELDETKQEKETLKTQVSELREQMTILAQQLAELQRKTENKE